MNYCRQTWLAIGLYMLLPGAYAFAEQKTWDGGGGNTDWNTAANWSPDGVPVATDDVLIGAAFPSVVHSMGTNGVATLNCATDLTISGSITLIGIGNSFSNSTLSGEGAVTICTASTLSIAKCGIARPLINDGALVTLKKYIPIRYRCCFSIDQL